MKTKIKNSNMFFSNSSLIEKTNILTHLFYILSAECEIELIYFPKTVFAVTNSFKAKRESSVP